MRRSLKLLQLSAVCMFAVCMAAMRGSGGGGEMPQQELLTMQGKIMEKIEEGTGT